MAYDNNDGRLRGRKLQATRLRIWGESGGLCARCRKLIAYPDGFELDHIKAVSASTDQDEMNDDSNLQVLCIEVKDGVKTGCHVDKTAEDMGYVKRAQFDSAGRVVW